MKRVLAWVGVGVLGWVLGWWEEYFYHLLFGGPALVLVLSLGVTGRPLAILRALGVGLVVGSAWAAFCVFGAPELPFWPWLGLTALVYGVAIYAQAEAARAGIPRRTTRKGAIWGTVVGHALWWAWFGVLYQLQPQGRWDELLFLAAVLLLVTPAAALGAVGGVLGALPRAA